MKENIEIINREVAERHSLKRVVSLSTELEDITEVEYRKLRLEKVILVGVWLTGSVKQMETALEELASLANTAGAMVLAGVYQKRSKPDASTYIGKGKVAELKMLVNELGADTVICDGELSPAQLTALEKELNIKVIDRTALILDIFAQHAKSKEGKAQIELAQLEYMLPRLRGWGTTLSRQAGGRAGSNGGVGLRGPGETKIEIDRRRIRQQIAKLKREIVAIKKNRLVKNANRLRSSIPKIAILGYTNAGKSSLLNRLAEENLLVEDALFATLDPASRKVTLPGNKAAIFTDTVGFVSFLPTQLVEAFRSTLDEINYADLLVVVVNGAAPLPKQQYSVVRKIIDEVLETTHSVKTSQIVINKSDLLNEEQIASLQAIFPTAIFVSTLNNKGIEKLKLAIADQLESQSVKFTLAIPVQEGQLLANLYKIGKISSLSIDGDNLLLTVETANEGRILQDYRDYLQ